MANDFTIKKPADIKVDLGEITVILNNGGDAAENEILEGKTAYVGGELITGTIPNSETYEREITANTTYLNDLVGKYVNTAPKITADLKTGYEQAALIITDNAQTVDFNECAAALKKQTGLTTFYIKDYAFYYSENLKNISLPKYTYPNWIKTEIGNYAFNSSGITGLLDLKDLRVESCGQYAFADCANLTEIRNTGAYSGNGGGLSVILPQRCFNNCTSLVRAEITPYTTTGSKIDTYAFYNCENLQYVSTGAYQTIGQYILRGCFALKEVKIGLQCTSMLAYVFGGGQSTQSAQEFNVIFYGAPPTITTSTFGSLTSSVNTMKLNIYVADAYYSQYLTATNWVAVNNKWGIHKLSEKP